MSSLQYGLMIILLTWSKIVSANDQQASDGIFDENILSDVVPLKHEKDSFIKSSVDTHENIINRLTKRSISPSGINQLNYQYYYNQRPLQPVPANSPYSMYPSWQPQVYQVNPPVYQLNPPAYQMNLPAYQMNPPVYQDNTPYYAPAWNNLERPQPRIEPQPAYLNFEYPIDNPPIGYLPRDKNCQPQPCTNPSVNIGNRDNFDGPIWGTIPGVKPTRPTRRPGQGPVTLPPLIHNPHDSDESEHKEVLTSTTPASAVQPSKCVWAIVSCCSASYNQINYSCFEQLGCSGAFWDTNPCDSEFARAAIANVMKYYQSK